MTNDYAVLVRTIGTAVLTECGFISNKQDAARFASDEGQEDLAQALAKGVMRIKPMINFDPPECELAKCGIYERKFVEKERKLAGSSKSTPSRSSGSSKVSRKKKTAS